MCVQTGLDFKCLLIGSGCRVWRGLSSPTHGRTLCADANENTHQ